MPVIGNGRCAILAPCPPRAALHRLGRIDVEGLWPVLEANRNRFAKLFKVVSFRSAISGR